MLESLRERGFQIEFHSHAQGAGQRLEATLRDMVRVRAGAARDVQRNQRIEREGAEKFL